MFKKKVSFGKESLISFKDKKSLLKRVNIIADKSTVIKQVGLSGSKCKVYYEKGASGWEPILIENNKLFFTVFKLWKEPDLLPKVFIWPQVSCFVINGADLMWPGVANYREVNEKCKVGDVVSVSVINNLPFAVGVISSLCSGEARKGKCVEIVHYYRDELWMMHQFVPNEGFHIDIVNPIMSGNDEEEESDDEVKENGIVEIESKIVAEIKDSIMQNDEKGNIQNINTKEEEEEVIILMQENHVEDETAGENPISSHEKLITLEEPVNISGLDEKIVEQEKSFGNLEQVKENVDLVQDFPEELKIDSTTQPVNIDENIMLVFLTTLKVGITDTQLPIEPSSLLSMMNRCKRSIEIPFNQSSYKKIGKFLESAHKLNIISYEKPKSHDHKLITSINRAHSIFHDFTPLVSKPKNQPNETLPEDSVYPKITFTYGFIAKRQYNYIFSAFADDFKPIFDKSEVNGLLTKYIALNKLDANKNCVRIDKDLKKALGCEGDEIGKAELYQKFKVLFDEGYLEEYSSGLMPSVIRIGPVPVVTVSLEKSKYVKMVTKVKGLDAFLIDMNEISRMVQRKFAASATIKQKTLKNKIFFDLQVHGDHQSEVKDLLSTVYKIPNSCIIVQRRQ